jgi:hypothetical protein
VACSEVLKNSDTPAKQAKRDSSLDAPEENIVLLHIVSYDPIIIYCYAVYSLLCSMLNVLRAMIATIATIALPRQFCQELLMRMLLA